MSSAGTSRPSRSLNSRREPTTSITSMVWRTGTGAGSWSGAGRGDGLQLLRRRRPHVCDELPDVDRLLDRHSGRGRSGRSSSNRRRVLGRSRPARARWRTHRPGPCRGDLTSIARGPAIRTSLPAAVPHARCRNALSIPSLTKCERGPARALPGTADLAGQDDDRRVEGASWPEPFSAVEHPLPHYARAGTFEGLLQDAVVQGRSRPASPSLRFSQKNRCWNNALLELHAIG